MIFLRWNVFGRLPKVLPNSTQILQKMYRRLFSLSQLQLGSRWQAKFLVTTYRFYCFGQLQSTQSNLRSQVMLLIVVVQLWRSSDYEI
jgi:hypothetical protein